MRRIQQVTIELEDGRLGVQTGFTLGGNRVVSAEPPVQAPERINVLLSISYDESPVAEIPLNPVDLASFVSQFLRSQGSPLLRGSSRNIAVSVYYP
jgi:hypothetical protein